jgi:hypothetical protein
VLAPFITESGFQWQMASDTYPTLKYYNTDRTRPSNARRAVPFLVVPHEIARDNLRAGLMRTPRGVQDRSS